MDKGNKEIKISGVRDPENIADLCQLHPKYLALDFRATSDRYVGEIDEALLAKIPHTIRKIGIFDDQSPLYISYIAGRFSLTGVQLETDVTARTCEILAAEGLEIIKVISSLSHIDKYEGICNKFLIRDCKLLDKYQSKTPLIVDIKIYRDGIDAIVDISEDYEDRVALKNYQKIEDWIQNIV